MRARILIRHLLWVGLPFLASYLLADFSLKISLALSIIFWLLFARTQLIWEYLAARERFEPFRVDVTFKWAKLLRDYKLVESDEQLRELFARKALSDGFSFTVLRPTPGWTDLRGLLYSDDRFLSKVDLWSRVEGGPELAVLNGEPRVLGKYLSAFVKRGTNGGFDLGIEVNDDWWEQFCATEENRELTKVRMDEDHLCGTVKLKIATLPYAEFGMYFGSEEEYSLKRAEREQRERDRILAKFGWKSHQEEYEADLPWTADPPKEIEHKYFTVFHRPI